MLRGKGRKEPVFDPPREWETDEDGRPVCLPSPAGGAWRVVVRDDYKLGPRQWVFDFGPRMFPTLGGQDRHHGFGRPRLQDGDPERVRYVAWRVDVHRWSQREVARDLYGEDDADRLRARRELRAGRELLHVEGVLPWAAWPAGNLPAEWWREERFWRAVNRWARETMLRNIREASLVPVRVLLGQDILGQSSGTKSGQAAGRHEKTPPSAGLS
jgi:hypothetical protein